MARLGRLLHPLRQWQAEAYEAWRPHRRGIVTVVTGAGKTYLALHCIVDFLAEMPQGHVLITVPTTALQDQWHAALVSQADFDESAIGMAGGGHAVTGSPRIVIAILNTARDMTRELTDTGSWFLVVDECHHSGAEVNRRIFQGRYEATLGLSATPERQHDDWFETVIVPALGEVVYEYTYVQAVRDGVIAAFELWNIKVPLTPDEDNRITSLNRSIAKESARLSRDNQPMSDRLKRLLLARSRESQGVQSRISTTIALTDMWHGRRGIIFHESIEAATALTRTLESRHHRVRLYHSGLYPATRYEHLRLYIIGQIDIIVCCRALDEGLDVPDTQYGIIAASTTSARQRIQRLGRILRPALDKKHAVIATMYALSSEERALQHEHHNLVDVAGTKWYEAKRIATHTD